MAPVPASTAAATANKKIAQSPAESYNKGNETAPLLYGGWHNADAFILAGSPSQSSLRDASSPKVGALGSPRKVHLFAKASPFGRGVTVGDGEGEPAVEENIFRLFPENATFLQKKLQFFLEKGRFPIDSLVIIGV